MPSLRLPLPRRTALRRSAISSIELLKLFIELGEMHAGRSDAEIQFFQWKLICIGSLHGVFVVSGLIFAFTEKESEKTEHSGR